MARSHIATIVSVLSFAFLSLAAPPTYSLETRASSQPVQFNLTLTWEDYSPNGAAPRKAIMCNGQFPGPQLTVAQGQNVEFWVHNNLPNETTVHFHGITQLKTPWSDGVPGLSQKPIQPGKSFLYQWIADESGMYFYHAHYQGQIMDGLYGPIYIQPKASVKRPWKFIDNDTDVQAALTAADNNVKPVFLSDWSSYTSSELLEIERSGNIDVACADSILVNGIGSVYCLSRADLSKYTLPNVQTLLNVVHPSQLTDKGCLPPNLPGTQGAGFKFDTAAIPSDAYYNCTPSTGDTATLDVDPANKWAAFSFINTGGFELLKFTIDGHKMWVYQVDGQYIEPQWVDQVGVNNGERYNVLIALNQTVADYAIRVTNMGLNQIISGYGILSYKGAASSASVTDQNSLSVMNYAGVNTTEITTFIDPLAFPYPAGSVALKADATYFFHVKKLEHPWTWTLFNNVSYNTLGEDHAPLLFKDPSKVDSDVVIHTYTGQWIDLIIQVDGPLAQPHPMHKHSNKAYLIGQAVGPFIWKDIDDALTNGNLPNHTINLYNPPFRDGFLTIPAEGNSSWTAIRYNVQNPGAFILHCHMQTHLSGGMAFALMDGVDRWPATPTAYTEGDGQYTSLQPMAKVSPVS